MTLVRSPLAWLLLLAPLAPLPCLAQTAATETAESAPATSESPAENAGVDDLNEAFDAKLAATSLEDLEKVIDKARSGLNKGLDEPGTILAKDLISSTAFQKAQLLYERLQTGQIRGRAAQTVLDSMQESLQLALEYNPDLGVANLLLAKLHVQRQDLDAARKAVAAAIDHLESNAQRAEARLMRAVLTDDDQQRIDDARQATELDPENVGGWQLLIEAYMVADKKEEALEAVKRFMETKPTDITIVIAIAEKLIQLDQFDMAKDFIDQRIEDAPDDPMLRRLRAQVRLQQDDIPGALEDLNVAIEKAPQEVAGYLLRGQAHLVADPPNAEAAQADIDKALTLQPGNIFGIQLRAQIAATQERYAEAISDYQLLVRNQPDNATLLLQLANLYQADKRPSEAIKAVEAVLRIEPENWQAYRVRGDALLSIGSQKEAIVDYEAAIEKAGDDENIDGLINNLAWVLATSPQDEIRNGDRAIELATRAAERTEYAEAYILSTLAAAYAEKGDFETARKWSEKAVELAEKEDDDSLPQLREELESYKNNRPYRELQQTEEQKRPNIQIEEGVDV